MAQGIKDEPYSRESQELDLEEFRTKELLAKFGIRASFLFEVKKSKRGKAFS